MRVILLVGDVMGDFEGVAGEGDLGTTFVGITDEGSNFWGEVKLILLRQRDSFLGVRISFFSGELKMGGVFVGVSTE